MGWLVRRGLYSRFNGFGALVRVLLVTPPSVVCARPRLSRRRCHLLSDTFTIPLYFSLEYFFAWLLPYVTFPVLAHSHLPPRSLRILPLALHAPPLDARGTRTLAFSDYTPVCFAHYEKLPSTLHFTVRVHSEGRLDSR